MKKLCALMALTIWCLASPAMAEEFGGLKIMDGGRTVKAESKELVKEYDAAPEVVRQFYNNLLEKEQEIRIRDRGDTYVIEDLGGRGWRRIAIVKDQAGKTRLEVDLMSWGWMMMMLALRFTAVFVVLLVLYLSTSMATKLLSRVVKDQPKPVA